jgi:molecular chaperone DnaK
MAAPIIGIDLGTTNSCVAVIQGGEPVVIHNQEGGRTTPSMVSFNVHGDILVGAAAKRQAVTNPRNTLYAIKRLIGRRSKSSQVDELRRMMPYAIVEAANGDAWVRIGEKDYSPQEIAAHVLEKMKRIAEEYLGEVVSEAIVTVPAYFDDVQRQATKDAGRIAGLKVRQILNEPTAAALAFGLHQQRDQRVAVFDLGGGTFDISILAIENGVFEVLATNGDTMLGGDDFDRKLIDQLVNEFRAETGIDLGVDPVALQRLKEAAERAKIELSAALVTDINLPFLSVGPSGPLHLMREVKRVQLSNMTKDLVARVEGPVRAALRDAKMGPQDIDQVVLVGGMTRMPAIQEKVEELFGKKPSKGVNPDEIVAVGAAVQSAIMGGELQEVVLLDVTPHSVGIKVAGDRVLGADPAQHDGADAREQDLQHDGGRSGVRGHRGLPRRGRGGGAKPTARPLRPGRHPTSPGGPRPRGGVVHGRRRRDPARGGAGADDGQGDVDHDPGDERPVGDRGGPTPGVARRPRRRRRQMTQATR